MACSAILDFDGTITDLEVNWEEVRNCLGVSRISDVWRYDANSRIRLLNKITEFELKGVRQELKLPVALINSFDSYYIISNNSELAINSFYYGLETNERLKLKRPTMVVAREKLQGPKEDFSIFKKWIETILCNYADKPRSKLSYIGDQQYELDYSELLGIQPIHVSRLK